jgi:hypothetical protein
MDPGDQLYTLDELRCWKVENLGVLDDERSIVNKTSKRLKNDVDIENHRIIQTERPLTTRILLRLDFGLKPLTTKIG